MDLELGGRVVVVTGGSDGLGLALGHRLVSEGARVALCARTEDRLRAAADELRRAGGDVLDVVADVGVPDDLRALTEATVERWGRLDGVVNNAGRSAAAPVAETTDGQWEEDLDLKLMASVRLSRFALPHLEASGGAIVNVLAVAAKAPGPGSAPSSVSRAAGMALTKALSKEVGPRGVRVNAVLIGLIESGQWRRMAEASGTAVEDLYQRMAQSSGIPLGRVGRAAEFADLTAYLLSSRSSYVTGTAINLDGGLSPTV
ncbi:MAG TPA: SDR family oxidoreductase [Acidimicrobiales bacterium]|nr:SDR family oxidoreductase [Acidimicrobiales bacterium]